MKNVHNNIITSPRMRFFLLLVLAYYSQIHPFSHEHHAHQDSFQLIEISSFPVETNAENSADHHHDGDHQDGGRPSHTNDHQHSFDKHIDWFIIRTQDPKNLSFDKYYISPTAPDIFISDNNQSYNIYVEYSSREEYQASLLIIRGPPQFS